MKPFRFRVCAGTLFCVVLVAGCGVSSAEQPTSVADDDLWQWVLSEANSGDVSESQLAVLEEAADSGILSLDALQVLIGETFACFDRNGIPYEMDELYSVVPGADIPQYRFGPIEGLSPDESLKIADACIEENSLFAEMAYQQQPSFQELVDEQQMQELPEAIQCLKDEGVDIDENATLDEVRTETRRLIMRQMEADIDPALWVYCLSSYEPQ